MSLRLAKKIIYGFFYILLWTALAAAVYFLFLKPTPSCFDNVQNQDEAGVDCGGVCAKVCVPKDIKSIEVVGHVSTFVIDKDHASFLVRVKNPNSAYASRSFKYSFSIYDSNGRLIKSLGGESSVYASEIKYILAANVLLDSQSSLGKIDFAVADVAWDSAENFRGPLYVTVQDAKTNVSSGGLVVEGRVYNNDSIVSPRVKVVATFAGRFGELAGASETELENLAPNESRPFSIFYPAESGIDASSTKVFVYSSRP